MVRVKMTPRGQTVTQTATITKRYKKWAMEVENMCNTIENVKAETNCRYRHIWIEIEGEETEELIEKLKDLLDKDIEVTKKIKVKGEMIKDIRETLVKKKDGAYHFKRDKLYKIEVHKDHQAIMKA